MTTVGANANRTWRCIRPSRAWDTKWTKDYEIGRNKPPQHSRFQPGQSDNPGGRRKGSKNKKTTLDKILGETVDVADGGKKRRMPRDEAFLTSLWARLMKDNKAAALLISLMEKCCLVSKYFDERTESREMRIRLVGGPDAKANSSQDDRVVKFPMQPQRDDSEE
jgi:hypothetical protein